MTNFMQTASALTLAAALAGVPMVVAAQQTETKAEQAVENAAQATGNAVENAADAVGNAASEVVKETDQALTDTPEAAEEKAEAVEEAAEDKAEMVEETSEEKAEAIEEAGEEKADAIEEQADKAATAEAPVEEVKGAIRMQGENSILTSDLIGATIYNSQVEKIGEVDDAILSLDGTIEGVVIGVGGFLGLGEKHVAVEVQQLSVQTDEDGKPQLFLDSTREALEAAPEFVTAEDQRAEARRLETERAASTAPVTGMSTSDTVPVTVVPPVPATEGEPQPVKN